MKEELERLERLERLVAGLSDEKLERLAAELRALVSRTWVDPIQLHEVFVKLENARADKRGSDEGDSDRGMKAEDLD